MKYEDGEVFIKSQLCALVRRCLFEENTSFLDNVDAVIYEFCLEEDDKERLRTFSHRLLAEFEDNVFDFIKEL